MPASKEEGDVCNAREATVRPGGRDADLGRRRANEPGAATGRRSHGLRAAVPEANEAAEVERGFLVAHVKLDGASISIDAGLGPPRPDWPVRRTSGIEAALPHATQEALFR